MWPQSRYRGRRRVYLQAMRPPHLYTKFACTAKRNFDHECKKTFATKSATSGLMHRSKPNSLAVALGSAVPQNESKCDGAPYDVWQGNHGSLLRPFVRAHCEHQRGADA